MANADVSCPKCTGRMAEGFALERGHYNTPGIGSWVDGPWVPPPKKMLAFGDPLRLRERQQWPITGYRCTSCGYLESYAK
jgi:hypothetical protein